MWQLWPNSPHNHLPPRPLEDESSFRLPVVACWCWARQSKHTTGRSSHSETEKNDRWFQHGKRNVLFRFPIKGLHVKQGPGQPCKGAFTIFAMQRGLLMCLLKSLICHSMLSSVILTIMHIVHFPNSFWFHVHVSWYTEKPRERVPFLGAFSKIRNKWAGIWHLGKSCTQGFIEYLLCVSEYASLWGSCIRQDTWRRRYQSLPIL